MGKQIPELNYLLKEVERHYGRRLATSTDFEALSVLIEREINEMIWLLLRSYTPLNSLPEPIGQFIG